MWRQYLDVNDAVIRMNVLAIIAVAMALYKKHVTPRLLNTALLCMALITVGYSSYAVIVIRSYANPPMDQNSPEDVFTLGEYLGREQYGDRPLFYGQTYNSVPKVVEDGQGRLIYDTKKGAKVYQKKEKASADEKDQYVVANEKFEYVYPSNQCMFFPRIYSDKHKGLYE